MSEDEMTTIDRLARIEVKLDMLVDQRANHEGRLGRVEKFMWVAVGLACASGGYDLSQFIA